MPQVTVIIPNYNHGSYLQERMESVINQTLRDIELIIIDDCSTDNSRDIINTYKHHPLVNQIIYQEVNSGSPYRQWNQAFQLAKAEWIWVAESDDLADPQFLEKLYQKALPDEQTSLVYCDSLILTENEPSSKTKYSTLKNERYQVTKWNHPYQQDGKTELNEYLKLDCTINNVSAVLFRKSWAMEVMKKMEGFRFHGDWMFYIQMAEKGRVIYLAEALNYYREHAGNHSKTVTGAHFNKPECFRILSYLLSQPYITGKKELIRHFINEYIGFGFRKDRPFSSHGLYWQYRAINPRLALKVILHLIRNKITSG